MAPGYTKRKKKVDEAAARWATMAANATVETPVVEPAKARLEARGGGGGALDSDDGYPRSIRTKKRGRQEPGLGGALKRAPKTKGGARVSRNDPVVENLRSQLAAVIEQNRIEKEQGFIKEMHQRMARMEAALNDFIMAQGNPGVNVATTTPIIADKSLCASSCIPEEDLH